jgi:integrase
LNLQKLNPDHIQTTYKKMVDSGLSARTVLHSHRVLNVALKDAVKWGHLVNNPASKVDPPKPKKKEMEVWDAEAVSRFMKAASPSPYYSAFSLAVLTGMRRSELAGLKWSDIDLESKRLHITRTRQRISGLGIVEGPPKTHRSSRSIALSELAMKTFIRVRNKQSKTRLLLGATWPNTDYVFTYETGEPIDPETLTKEFKRIVRRNGLSHGTLHGLRHAFATALLTQNVHPAVVQSALGHSSIGITIDTYSHVIPGLEEAAARTIDQALGIAFAKEA